jgi:hypothetical protein
LSNEELCNFFSSPNYIKATKTNRAWVDHNCMYDVMIYTGFLLVLKMRMKRQALRVRHEDAS